MYKSEEELVELQRLYDNGLLKPTAKEKLIINPKVAYEVTNSDIAKSIPEAYLSKNADLFGKINNFSRITPTDNLLWDYLFFRDVSVFRPAALAFEASKRAIGKSKLKPSYTHYVPNSTNWKKFWLEEVNRIINGYEPIVDGKPCGIRIPGEYYFYLNYGMIKKIIKDEDGLVAGDVMGFPNFLAMDYYYLRELEAREKPALYGLPYTYKKSLVVVKARRMGFSYKASVGSVYLTAFDRNNLVIIASGTGDDATTCFNKSAELMDFLTEYTPFGLEAIGSPESNGGWKHVQGSRGKATSGLMSLTIKSTKTSETIGRKSIIKTVSLHNEDDAISGEGLARCYFEESGKTTNLQAAWTFAEPAMMVGKMYRKGIAVIFGTGGEMSTTSGKAGSSVGLKNLFYQPSSGGLGTFRNIYDYSPNENECGLFFGAMWFYESPPIMIDGKVRYTIDSNGNPCFWVAEVVLNMDRESKRKGGINKKEYERFLTQYCKTPNEAFLISQGTRFQAEDLIKRHTDISSSLNSYHGLRMPGELVESNGSVIFIPKPDLQPITPETVTSRDREGCLLRYQVPLDRKDKKTGKYITPPDAYMISVDPIGINTDGGDSLIAIIVFNTGKYGELGDEGIAATYYGRPKINPVDYMCRLLLKLSRYYNAKISFENDRGGDAIFNYFLKNKALDRLLPMPQIVTATHFKNSKTSLRPYGHSMSSAKHKDMGETYLYEWLDQRNHEGVLHDEETGQVYRIPAERNLDRLNDEMLIHQLINYVRGGNYDAVSAFMGIMLQMQEIYEINKAFSDNNAEDFRTSGIGEMYNKAFNIKKFK